MQKQKLTLENLNPWLCISSNYDHITISLCFEQTIVESHTIDKKSGNQRLLPDIDMLLKHHNLLFKDLIFIGVNLGPAPYTGLRIALATANGLHLATNIPLVGIDALKAFVHDYPPHNENQATVALLNAFNNDLFYAIAYYDGTLQTGYEKASLLHERLAKELNGLKIDWIGNGAPESTLDYPSQNQLVAYAWQNWQKNETINLALPLYLKRIA